MKNKFLVLTIATVLSFLIPACKKEDANVAIWTLTNVQCYSSSHWSDLSPFSFTDKRGIHLVSSTLSIMDTFSYANYVSLDSPSVYKNYSLKLNIQKGGALAITESHTRTDTVSSPRVMKTVNSYWNYLNTTVQNDEIVLSGLSSTLAGAASDKYSISQTNGTLTLTFQSYITNPVSLYASNRNISDSSTTNVLTFTK